MRRISEWSALTAIVVLGAAARLWFLTAGVPHAVGIDEPQVIDRALRILHTGEWNPHLFDYPTLVIYLHAGVAILRFLWGALNGEWASLDAFSITAVFTAARFVTAVIGISTIWLTWRLAREIASPPVALLAAALIAVRSPAVREAHYALTDTPMTALVMLALWLAARAARVRTASAYAWAGAACGLAAAAKYNGGLAIVAVAVTWLLYERTAYNRRRKAAAIVASAAGAFLLAAPYTLLAMPEFLNGFAAQFARFATAGAAEAPWLTYLKHLSPPAARWSVPVALAGVVVLLARSGTRRAAAPAIAFALVFFYALSTHSPVFGRYALPLGPLLCLCIAAAAVEAVRALQRIDALRRPAASRLLWTAVIVLLVWSSVGETVRWLDGLKRADTRTIAADWMKSSLPPGARVAVENNGPTYLSAAGFRVVGTQLLIDRPLDWLRPRVDYLVISAADLARYDDYLRAGETVFQINPGQRWGPPIVIVKIR